MGTYWPTQPLSDALEKAAQQEGFPFIDGSNWIIGTGKEDDKRGDGNADDFRSSDGTHPTTAGHLFLGQKVAEAMRPLIAAK